MEAKALDKRPPLDRRVSHIPHPEPMRRWDGSQKMPTGPRPWLSGLPIAVLASLAACSAVERTSADRFKQSGQLIALSGGDAGAGFACFTCHGLDGRGDGAGAARLAGLDLGYMDRQLEAYAGGLRQHPVMEEVSRRLSPADRHKVSAFYATLPFEPAPSLPSGPGAAFYFRGAPERGLPACAACHGLRGQGIGPANPPLAGQPAPYLAQQIESWRHSKRRNDPGNVMLRISQLLTPAEAARVSAYASALPGDPLRPEPPEASLEARRGDPRNDASRLPPHGLGPGP